MRILLATETFLPHVDGIVTRLTQTIEHLCRAGDEVMVLTPWRPGIPAEFEGARVITLPSRPWPQYQDIYLALPWLTSQVVREIRAFKPDLVHAACPAFLGSGIIPYARHHHLPLVASYHVQYAEYVRRYQMQPLVSFVWWYLHRMHDHAQLNLATSRAMVRELRGRGFPHMKLWRPGVDTVLFDPARRQESWRQRLSAGHPNDLLLVCISRLAREKQIAQLVPVLRALPGVRLALVGDGPERTNLEQAFVGLPAHFAGMQRGEDLAAAYAAGDVFVLPSTTETLGLVALEAMAAGVPAVVANAGGLPDLVVPGETGYLVAPDQPAAFIERLRTLRDDRALLDHMALAARRHAETFTWEVTTDQLRQYYAHVLARYPQPAAEDFVPPLAVATPADAASW